MKKKIAILWILSIVLTCVLTYHSTSKANPGLQSKGKIIYSDETSGEEIIIDTNDHELLKDNIIANADEIISIKQFIAEQKTKNEVLEEEMASINGNISKQDLQWYIDNGWLPPIPAQGEVPQNLEDCSWNMIQQLVASDTFKNYYSVGDTKSVTLSTGEVVYMQVASINDGEGDAGVWYPKGTVDFISKDCLQTTYAVHTGGSVEWESTNLYSTLNNTIINTLPLDLQNVIVNKTYKASGMNALIVEHSEKIWLPTEYEIFGVRNVATTNSEIIYNKQYGIFTDNASRTKKLGKTGNNSAWRLSSIMNSNAYVCVNASGGNFTAGSYQYLTAQLGIPLCFRIG